MKAKTTKWQQLKTCPEWWLVKAFGSGKNDWSRMINAVAETFSSHERGTPTHIHFYTTRLEEARQIYRQLREGLPDTIETFSIGI